MAVISTFPYTNYPLPGRKYGKRRLNWQLSSPEISSKELIVAIILLCYPEGGGRILMFDRDNLAKMIVQERNRMGLTQKQLADMLHVSYQAVSRWEQGASIPSVELLYDLATALGISTDSLLTGQYLTEHDITYRDSGFDTHRLYEIKDRLQELVSDTPLFLDNYYTKPVLYQTDVAQGQNPVHILIHSIPGSKLRLAKDHGCEAEICADMAANAINAIAACGGKPLFYKAGIICGNMDGELLIGMGKAFKNCCESQDTAFAGLEVGCQPINFRSHEYELYGFCSGVARREELMTRDDIREGDAVIGIHTDGIHGISYPFVHVMLERNPRLRYAKIDEEHYFPDELIRPTAAYYKALHALREAGLLHGAFQLTNALNNPYRFTGWLPENLCFCLDRSQVPMLPLFRFIAAQNMISRQLIPLRFHMGIGMFAVVPAGETGRAMKLIEQYHPCVCLGEIQRKTQPSEECIREKGEFAW